MIKQAISVLLVRSYKICIDGCYLFDEADDKALTECPHCGKKRPGDKKLQLIDIAAKMSELLASADTVQEKSLSIVTTIS
jgi:hypothetical protein